MLSKGDCLLIKEDTLAEVLSTEEIGGVQFAKARRSDGYLIFLPACESDWPSFFLCLFLYGDVTEVGRYGNLLFSSVLPYLPYMYLTQFPYRPYAGGFSRN